MSDFDLQIALEPVKEHFHGTKVTSGTVLAAHLRANGAEPSGDVWESAKLLLRAGRSFAEAAHTAAANFAEAQPAGETSEDSEADAPPQIVFTDDERTRIEFVSSDLGDLRMDWFPKRFGPGDIDGEGAKKLLGTPNIALVSVLVRETAQNSWDARTGEERVTFELHLRRLTQATVEILRSRVFTGDATGLPIAGTLNGEEVWALEVVDRGTSGLNGPIRNDLVVPPGVPTNFQDLVLNVGAPRDVELGGGTYGFGKTIAYTTSSCGTVLIWSRSEEPDGLEHRLIGSAIGENFDDPPYRYTGRHWWGRAVEDRVEPLTGEPAQSLAESIFDRPFENDETGTSLLILDPLLGGDSPEESAVRLQQAVSWHLWPKLLESRAGDVAMDIAVVFEGRTIAIPDPDDDPVLSGFAAALRRVRAAQTETTPQPAQYPVEVVEIASLRPRKLLGHLALTRYPIEGRQEHHFDDVAALPSAAHHVALMRHSAELVVKYLPGLASDTDGFQWAGVFKPVPDVDDSFSKSEPPAHDDWVPNSIQNKAQARNVRIALNRIRDTVTDFVLPLDRNLHSSAETSVAGIADALSDLIPTLDGPRATPRETTVAASKPKRPAPRIDEYRLGPAIDGRRLTAFRIHLAGSDEAMAVRASCGVGVDGGSDSSPDDAFLAGWSSEEPNLDDVISEPAADLHRVSPAGCWLLVNARSDLAVDLRVELGGE